jgi:hypothetical protein
MIFNTVYWDYLKGLREKKRVISLGKLLFGGFLQVLDID